MNTTTVTLTDGRQLGYAEYGASAGHPVLIFHGFPGSRLQTADFPDAAKAQHCRLIGIDRPGMGLSSCNPQHTLLSWADDISSLVNHLIIEKFSIFGHSGGAPFVMACAYAIPERITSAAIVSGIAPTTLSESQIGLARGQRILIAFVRFIPGFALLMMQLQHLMFKLPKNLKNKMYQKMILQLPPVDQAILQDPARLNTMLIASAEAFKQGAQGATQEFRLISNPWGFDLEKIKIPITIWQGELDKQVPLSHAKLYQARLPNAQLQLFNQEGHISTLYNHIGSILSQLIHSPTRQL